MRILRQRLATAKPAPADNSKPIILRRRAAKGYGETGQYKKDNKAPNSRRNSPPLERRAP